MAHTQEGTGFVLVVDPAAGPECATAIGAALAEGRIATMVLRATAGSAMDGAAARAFIEAAHKRGVAVVVADDVALARSAGADGVHLAWTKDIATRYAQARAALGADAIIGADAGRSRHDAMLIGEAGADYIAFGIPPHVEDRETASERQADLVAWWSEIFEIPVVAFDAEGSEAAGRLARAGADFVAMALPSGLAPPQIAEWIKSAATAIRMRESAGT